MGLTAEINNNMAGPTMTIKKLPLTNLLLLSSFVLFGCESFAQPESLIYVSNEDSNDVTVISSASNTVLATIPVGKRPRGIIVSPDGKLVYVALSGSPKCPPTMPDEECDELITDKSADGIAELDTVTQQVVRILPSGSDPEQFDVNWETGRLYVSNEDSNQASVLDLVQGEIIFTAPTGLEPEGVRLSPDGKIVYITGEVASDVTVINAETGEEISRIPVGLRPREAIFTPDGTRAYVSAEFGTNIGVIDVASNTLLREIGLPEGSLPMGLVLSEDVSTLYVANGRGQTVVAIDLESEMVVASVEVGPRPWGLTMSLDGRYLYSANGPSDDVSVIDIASFSVIAKIPVGETPWGVAVGPAP
jgi:YVTN family beta-propeller protein